MQLYQTFLIICQISTIYANNAVGAFSDIAGGRFNLASGDYTFIGSGFNNSVYGDYSSNLAGLSNIVSGYNSHIIGRYGVNNANNSLAISFSPVCVNNIEESVNICAKNGIFVNGVSLGDEITKINKSIQWLSEHHQNTSNYLISEINERHQLHNDTIYTVHNKLDSVLSNTSNSIENIKLKLNNFVNTYNIQANRDNKTMKTNTDKIMQLNTSYYKEIDYLKTQLNESYFYGFNYLESQINKLNNTFISNLNQLIKINNTLEHIKLMLSNNTNISIEERVIMVNDGDSTFKTTIILLLSFAMLLFLLILGIVIDTRRKLIKNDKIHAGKQAKLKSMATETRSINDTSSNSTIEQGPRIKNNTRQRLHRLPRPAIRNKQVVNNNIPVTQQSGTTNPV